MAFPTQQGSPSLTKSGIEYWVQLNTPGDQKEGWVSDRNNSGVSCFTAWETSGEFVQDMLGYSQLIGSQLTRVLPEKNPLIPSQWCTECTLLESYGDPTQLAGSNNWPSFDCAVYAVTFNAPLYAVLEDDEVSREWDRFCVWKPKFSGRNQLVPGNSFLVIDDGLPAGTQQPIGQVGTILQKEVRYTCRWVDVPAIPAGIETCLGTINNSSFNFKRPNGQVIVCQARTLLFEDVEIEDRISPAGFVTQDITLSFKKKTGVDGGGTTITWQLLPRASRLYVGVSTTGLSSGQKPYLETDFSQIFAFP